MYSTGLILAELLDRLDPHFAHPDRRLVDARSSTRTIRRLDTWCSLQPLTAHRVGSR